LVAWYASSTYAKLKLYNRCRSSLFYYAHDSDKIEKAVVIFDVIPELVVCQHIFVADKGDCYKIVDHAPHIAKYLGVKNYQSFQQQLEWSSLVAVLLVRRRCFIWFGQDGPIVY
jgi:hypothetical protein